MTLTTLTTDARPATGGLRPSTLRWQPLRLGLANLFHYENEVFPFRDGRLLLRGNNGAGKSKVLALTLPFLFDGDTAARRIEPDADPGKRMEWNLLMGGEYAASERIGYSWLEFGRRGADGSEHFVTIGAGLKAARGQTGTKSWFFITRQRVGDELNLIDGNRIPLSYDRLAAEIGAAGHVYSTKRDYRHAVDEQLFGLGERRYDALMDLLIQIRAPQLSKRPSEKLLSDALTESLTPIPHGLIQSVADGMRGLDEYREELQQFVDTRKFVDAFLRQYVAYASVLVKRKAEKPRQTQSEHDAAGRLIIDLSAQAEQATTALVAGRAELDALQRSQAERDAESEALRDSEYAGLDTQLKATDSAATTAAQRRERASRQRQTAHDAHEREAKVVATTVARLTTMQDRLRVAVNSVVQTATVAGFGADPAKHADEKRARSRISDARAALGRVRELLAALDKVGVNLASARHRNDSADAALGDATAARQQADDAIEAAATAHVSEVEAHLATLTELAVHEDDFEAFAEWAPSGAGENPLSAALADSAAAVTQRLAGLRSQGTARIAALTDEIATLDELIAALQRGDTPAPPDLPTRVPVVDGLPLWRAVSFRDEVPAPDRAGIEAALEASGLLTAVVLEGGSLRDPASGEVVLRATGSADGVLTLGGLLKVDLPAGATLDPALVRGVLESINLGSSAEDPATNWVGADGHYRVGAARGAWSKPNAAFIGESARADARARRLATARTERAALGEEFAAQTDATARLAQRLETVRAEQRRLPAPVALEAARKSAGVAAGRAAHAADALERATADVAALEAKHGALRDELEADARALGLPTDAADINAHSDAIDAFEAGLGGYLTVLELHREAERAGREAAERLDDRTRELEFAEAELRDATTAATATAAAAYALRGRVGEDVRAYRERVAAVANEIESLKGRVTTAYEEISAVAQREAVVAEQLRESQEKLAAVAAERVSSIEALRRTAALGLVTVALGTLELPDAAAEWTVTQGVQVARAIDTALAELDASDTRFERVQGRLVTEYTILQPALSRHGNQALLQQLEDGYQVLVEFAGEQVSLPELAANLAGIIEAREALLGAREREVIENHLVTEVGTQLSELVGEAETQIANVNAELGQRPTTTGMRLRVRWKQRLDGPAGLADARARLSKIAAVWDESDRKALGEFLQGRIAEVRESDESGNWYDSLGDALDYRRWHHFVVERYQGGAWKPATGPASGGERVLAASIPLFAAASSHYKTASNPYAPRLVMLDEAFAGVDDSSRASCMGLLAAFDLDVVMTSEREWGCYAEVPGLSIAQLSRFEDTPAVLVQLWSWDGRIKTRVASPEPEAADGTMW